MLKTKYYYHYYYYDYYYDYSEKSLGVCCEMCVCEIKIDVRKNPTSVGQVVFVKTKMLKTKYYYHYYYYYDYSGKTTCCVL